MFLLFFKCRFTSGRYAKLTELEASKEGRSLENFYYACIGYSVYLDNKESSADSQDKTAKLPFCTGLQDNLFTTKGSWVIGHIYTGGSAMPMQTKAKMDDFTNNTTVATQQVAESGTNAEMDPDQVWRQTVSEPSEKNRVFGIGGFLASTLRISVFAPQASSVSLTSPAPVGPEEAVDLREQVQLLNQNIQDMARQLHESEERI
ncbi:hypothetical protein PIB30_096056 [Stylosanthes scabra]|uniref:DUF8204 domain-containing protein n=1 Tax=Stylosanthes scabra TaxID=79078 RepID=A0ABU6ZUM7_9FABA|nr:hypothetical protein [Stylosanthes scabra]